MLPPQDSRSARKFPLWPILAHRITVHLGPMRVVHEPGDNAIRLRGIADLSCQRETASCEVRILERT